MLTPEDRPSDGKIVIPARVKVVNPIGSVGPSVKADIVGFSDTFLKVIVPRRIIIGSSVMVRAEKLVMFGRVVSSDITALGFEIGVVVQETP